MIKIRLMRIGGRQRPFYRVVAVDERAKRTGGYLELLGTYNPLTEPKDIKLKQDRIDYWLKQGAQPSEGYLRIIGKAPQRPPRKPKREKRETPSVVKETPTTTSEESPSSPPSEVNKEPSDQKVEETQPAQPAQEKTEEKSDERSA